MRPMEMLDVLAPVLMIVGAVALVAVTYLVFTALKDRFGGNRDEGPIA